MRRCALACQLTCGPTFACTAGLARLPKLHKLRDPALRDAVAKWQQYEDEARKGHRGMWQYGDPGDSDDEADMGPRAPPRKR